MVRQPFKITSTIVESIFADARLALTGVGVTLSQGTIDLTIFKINKEKNLTNQAAVCMYYIAKDHPLTDGNKRMAYLLAELILHNQGLKINASYNATVKLLLRIADNKAELKEVKKWVEKHAVNL